MKKIPFIALGMLVLGSHLNAAMPQDIDQNKLKALSEGDAVWHDQLYNRHRRMLASLQYHRSVLDGLAILATKDMDGVKTKALNKDQAEKNKQLRDWIARLSGEYLELEMLEFKKAVEKAQEKQKKKQAEKDIQLQKNVKGALDKLTK